MVRSPATLSRSWGRSGALFLLANGLLNFSGTTPSGWASDAFLVFDGRSSWLAAVFSTSRMYPAPSVTDTWSFFPGSSRSTPCRLLKAHSRSGTPMARGEEALKIRLSSPESSSSMVRVASTSEPLISRISSWEPTGKARFVTAPSWTTSPRSSLSAPMKSVVLFSGMKFLIGKPRKLLNAIMGVVTFGDALTASPWSSRVT
mmetsp:Transcript_121112/g.343124  ORF Transcript_121112/g.343124 Transcript_121112/m.343124 type:complete len:202 (-) Transcript_121112:547-1152(-)